MKINKPHLYFKHGFWFCAHKRTRTYVGKTPLDAFYVWLANIHRR